MSKEEFYVAKWVTVEGETETKRFQSTSYPRIETHSDNQAFEAPPVFDIYSDEERELSILARRFIGIRRE